MVLKESTDQSLFDSESNAAHLLLKEKRDLLEESYEQIMESLSELTSYALHRRYLRLRKVRRDKLDSVTEALLVERAEIAGKALARVVEVAEKVDELIPEKLGEQIDKYFEQMGKSIRLRPEMKAFVHEFREMGTPAFGVLCIEQHFREAGYNPLRVYRADGTFGGLVRALEGAQKVFEDDVRALRQYGLPLLTGSDHDDDHVEEGVATGVAIAAAILCLIFCL